MRCCFLTQCDETFNFLIRFRSPIAAAAWALFNSTFSNLFSLSISLPVSQKALIKLISAIRLELP